MSTSSAAAAAADKRRLKLDAQTWPLARRVLAGYVKPYRGTIGLAVGAMAVMAIATGAMPQLLDPIINRILVDAEASLLWPIAIAAFAVFAVKGIATYVQAVLMAKVGLSIVADLQRDLFRRVMANDLAFFTETAPGVLVSRFIHDIGLMRNAVSNTVVGIGRDVLTALALGIGMFYQDWVLALLALVVLPLCVWPIIRLGRRMRKISGSTQQETGQLATLLDENFQGIRHVKSYVTEPMEVERAKQSIDEVLRLQLKGAQVRNLANPLIEVFGGLAIVAVIVYGGSQVIAGTSDPGSFTAFIAAALLAYEPLKRLAKLNANLQEGLAAAARIFDLMDRQPEVVSIPAAPVLQVTEGEVRLEDVDFSYAGSGGGSALQAVSLEAPAGRTVALVGPSGSGKTSVLNLIPRFYDPTSGRVTIDGQDLRNVDLGSLRRQVALVSQDIMLFDDSVRANIAYGQETPDPQEVERAARHAGAHDFILALPQGYDTQVGPRGVKLSGGQRQRIAIARAMLKNAPILLLDEATSALDTESERHVQQALSELMTGRTTIVIAHRLSTVIDADVIYVLEAGRVVERGTHAELLAAEGAYAKLYHLQFAETDSDSLTPERAGDISQAVAE
ncbi:ABC transporter ATP-binding protein [Algihabitans albus]|uniref:ABC transporter ATP-binding protein n=1 Tax=Algihabitans albus TaxID=2164067 RepID=UPI001EFF3E9A|nr:ABC transporter transmembrane domain-containing protein [Algihabitans albus]